MLLCRSLAASAASSPDRFGLISGIDQARHGTLLLLKAMTFASQPSVGTVRIKELPGN